MTRTLLKGKEIHEGLKSRHNLGRIHLSINLGGVQIPIPQPNRPRPMNEEDTLLESVGIVDDQKAAQHASLEAINQLFTEDEEVHKTRLLEKINKEFNTDIGQP